MGTPSAGMPPFLSDSKDTHPPPPVAADGDDDGSGARGPTTTHMTSGDEAAEETPGATMPDNNDVVAAGPFPAGVPAAAAVPDCDPSKREGATPVTYANLTSRNRPDGLAAIDVGTIGPP